jgi:hypothetical protein
MAASHDIVHEIGGEDDTNSLRCLRLHGIRVVELSALRASELRPLASALNRLDLRDFDFVAFHAPSAFSPSGEASVVELLRSVTERGLPVVVHPDVMVTSELWREFGSRLLLENMDKRKRTGRTARDLLALFDVYRDARLCFDIGHARQFDPTMTEARMILRALGERLAEVHISEVNTASRHDPLSANAIAAFRTVADLIPEQVPVILETLIDVGQSDVPTEIDRARRALDSSHMTVAR